MQTVTVFIIHWVVATDQSRRVSLYTEEEAKDIVDQHILARTLSTSIYVDMVLEI